ncbi:hypothetical protein QYE76_005631 [Lolium multiflorum]|uniref:Integrase catalytic domain-containing protein n=1 Tax=Lolium multiflorum TaxID=4521 RepID=A0AAD8RWT2_LOLMU|nr:hypothetical protein QYE76_005631 [Lolium multiflorum]
MGSSPRRFTCSSRPVSPAPSTPTTFSSCTRPYGLRQAPRAWNAKIDDCLKSLAFELCPLEHTLYRRGGCDNFLMIITGSDVDAIAKFKEQMHGMFRIRDLGLLSYYLGIEVEQRDDHITLSQASYALKILEAEGMQDCNLYHTPMDTRLKVGKNNGGDAMDGTKYRSVIGSLRYLVNTRPGLAFAVGFASRFIDAPGVHHWALVNQILRYLKGTVRYGCRYGSGSAQNIIGYSDSDHADDVDDRKSTSGVIFFFGSSIITWGSQKQKIVAQSSCEAEYIAAATAASQAVWLRRLLGAVLGKEPDRVKLCMDNLSAIALCKNPIFHDRIKHIDTRYHYIRECVEEGKVEVVHVGTNDQMGDILTKALPRANETIVSIYLELISSSLSFLARSRFGPIVRGKFNSNDFAAFCDEHGIKHFTTAPYSPQQNGVVERRNQTVVEMARSLLKSMGMPAVFWGEAMKRA